MVVTWAWGNGCNTGMGDLPDMYAQGPRAYISGKLQMHMLQVLITYVTVNSYLAIERLNPTMEYHTSCNWLYIQTTNST